MRKIRDALRLFYEKGQSKRAISKSVGISRDAVSDYVTRAKLAQLEWPLPDDIDDAELELRLYPVSPITTVAHLAQPNWAAVWQALKQKGSTREVLHSEWLEEHPGGMAYSYYCQRLRDFAGSLKRSMRQIHLAGDKVFVDYAGPTIAIHDVETGENRNAQIFVGVLGASSYIFCEAVWSQKLPEWISSHVRMFEHFGGVPNITVCDNLKSAVTRASRHDPDIHPTYQDLAAHYGTMIIPARPYKPKDKAKAENGVLIVERWILFRLRKRIFTSLEELNLAIRELLEDANSRPFKKLPGCRKSAFEAIDRPALQQLPVERYTYTEFRKVRAGYDYCFDLGGGHVYSVPDSLRNRELDVRITANTVEVLHGGHRVASHARLSSPGRSIDKAHMDPAHRYLEHWDGSVDLEWALGIGPNTHGFLQAVLAGVKRKELGSRATGALKAAEVKYGKDRLEAACTKAHAVGAMDIRHVTNMLKAKLDHQPSAELPAQEAAFDHANIRGSRSYH